LSFDAIHVAIHQRRQSSKLATPAAILLHDAMGWISTLVILLHVSSTLALDVSVSFSERVAEEVGIPNLLNTIETTYQFFDAKFSEDVVIDVSSKFCQPPSSCISAPNCTLPFNSTCTQTSHLCLQMQNGTVQPKLLAILCLI
jgi:hypothetical protein